MKTNFIPLMTVCILFFSCQDGQEMLPNIYQCADLKIEFPGISDWNVEMEPAKELEGQHVNSLHFLNETVGLAFMEESIWRTSDGGNHWQKVYEDFARPGSGKIEFATSHFGLISCKYYTKPKYSGLRHCLLVTRDAGLTWDTIATNPAGELKTMAFADALRGIAFHIDICYKKSIVKTVDGGQSWTMINGIGETGVGLNLMPDGFGYFGGTNGIVFFTQDYGDSWDSVQSPLEFISAIQFLNRDVGFVSNAYDYTGILKTTDGGVTWDTIATYGARFLNFFTPTDGFTVQIPGEYLDYDVFVACQGYLSTNDNGAHWTTDYPQYVYSGIPSFVNERLGYCYTISGGERRIVQLIKLTR